MWRRETTEREGRRLDRRARGTTVTYKHATDGRTAEVTDSRANEWIEGRRVRTTTARKATRWEEDATAK